MSGFQHVGTKGRLAFEVNCDALNNEEFCIEYLRSMAMVFGKNCTQVQ